MRDHLRGVIRRAFDVRALWAQIGSVRWIIVSVLAVGLAGSVLVVVLHRQTGTPFTWLCRDPAALHGTAVYIGLLSNLGALVWGATAGVCFLAAALGRVHGAARPLRRFFLLSGLFTLFLGLDDLFMFHEQVFPVNLGIREQVVYLAYIAIAGAYLWFAADTVFGTCHSLFYLALLFLGTSVVMDQLLVYSEKETFFEDSVKFTGILFWHAYFAHTALTRAVPGSRSS